MAPPDSKIAGAARPGTGPTLVPVTPVGTGPAPVHVVGPTAPGKPVTPSGAPRGPTGPATAADAVADAKFRGVVAGADAQESIWLRESFKAQYLTLRETLSPREATYELLKTNPILRKQWGDSQEKLTLRRLTDFMIETARSQGVPAEKVPEYLSRMLEGGDYNPAKVVARARKRATARKTEARLTRLLRSAKGAELAKLYKKPLTAAHLQGPGFFMNIVALFGLEGACDLLGICDPGERFAYIVGTTHAAQKQLHLVGRLAVELPAAALRHHAGRHFVSPVAEGVERAATMRQSVAQVAGEIRAETRALFAASATEGALGRLLASESKFARGITKAGLGLWESGKGAFSMGRDVITSDAIDLTVGNLLGWAMPSYFGKNGNGAPTTLRQGLHLGGFFLPGYLDIFHKQAATRFFAGEIAIAAESRLGLLLGARGLVATNGALKIVGKGLGTLAKPAGVAFGLGITTMISDRISNWDGADSIRLYKAQVNHAWRGESAFFSTDPHKVINSVANFFCSSELIEHIAAGESIFSTPMWLWEDAIVAMGFGHEENKSETIAGRVKERSVASVTATLKMIAHKGLRLMGDTTDNSIKISDLLAPEMKEYLITADAPESWQHYDKSKDTPLGFYDLVRRVAARRALSPDAEAFIQCINEDFLDLDPTDEDDAEELTNMVVLHPEKKAEGLRLLGKILGHDESLDTLGLAARRLAMTTTVLGGHITAEGIAVDHRRTRLDARNGVGNAAARLPESTNQAKASWQQLQGLHAVGDAHQLIGTTGTDGVDSFYLESLGDGETHYAALRDDTPYYTALEEIVRTTTTNGNAFKRRNLQSWVMKRYKALNNPNLPMARRRRILTELTIANPTIVFSAGDPRIQEAYDFMRQEKPHSHYVKESARPAIAAQVTHIRKTAGEALANSVSGNPRIMETGPRAWRLLHTGIEPQGTLQALGAEQQLVQARQALHGLETAKGMGLDTTYNQAIYHHDGTTSPVSARDRVDCPVYFPQRNCAEARNLHTDIAAARSRVERLEGTLAGARRPILAAAGTVQALQHLAAIHRLTPLPPDVAALIDLQTGLPRDAAAVSKLVDPILTERDTTDIEQRKIQSLVGHEKAEDIDDPIQQQMTPYQRAQWETYRNGEVALATVFDALWIDQVENGAMTLAGVVDGIQQQLFQPEFDYMSGLMQQQIVRIRRGVFHNIHVATLRLGDEIYNGHGQITNREGFAKWILDERSTMEKAIEARIGALERASFVLKFSAHENPQAQGELSEKLERLRGHLGALSKRKQARAAKTLEHKQVLQGHADRFAILEKTLIAGVIRLWKSAPRNPQDRKRIIMAYMQSPNGQKMRAAAKEMRHILSTHFYKGDWNGRSFESARYISLNGSINAWTDFEALIRRTHLLREDDRPRSFIERLATSHIASKF